jgi:hypothetical protein
VSTDAIEAIEQTPSLHRAIALAIKNPTVNLTFDSKLDRINGVDPWFRNLSGFVFE